MFFWAAPTAGAAAALAGLSVTCSPSLLSRVTAAHPVAAGCHKGSTHPRFLAEAACIASARKARLAWSRFQDKASSASHHSPVACKPNQLDVDRNGHLEQLHGGQGLVDAEAQVLAPAHALLVRHVAHIVAVY